MPTEGRPPVGLSRKQLGVEFRTWPNAVVPVMETAP